MGSTPVKSIYSVSKCTCDIEDRHVCQFQRQEIETGIFNQSFGITMARHELMRAVIKAREGGALAI